MFSAPSNWNATSFWEQKQGDLIPFPLLSLLQGSPPPKKILNHSPFSIFVVSSFSFMLHICPLLWSLQIPLRKERRGERKGVKKERDWSQAQIIIRTTSPLCKTDTAWLEKTDVFFPWRGSKLFTKEMLFTPSSSWIDVKLILGEPVSCWRVGTITKAPVNPDWGQVWKWHDQFCIFFKVRNHCLPDYNF